MKKPLLFFIVLFMFGNVAKAAIKTWTGTASVNWNNGTNWGGTVPLAGDDVRIGGGTTFAPTVNTASVCKTLTITSNVTLTLSNTLSVTAGLTINSGFIFTVAGNSTATIAGTTTFAYEGSLNISSTTATINFSGNVNLSAGNAGCKITNSGTLIFTSVNFTSGYFTSITNTGTFTMTSGTLINVINNNFSIINSGTLNATGSTLSLVYQSSTLTNSNICNFSNSTISLDFNTSNITNSGTFTINSGSVINLSGYQDYIINSGTFYAGTSNSACTINVSGQGKASSPYSVTNTGTFYLGSTSAINLTGADSFNPTKLSNTGTFTFQSDANGSAMLGQLSTGGSAIGTYNVQRYMSGAVVSKRGYRLLSSPVYTGTSAGQNSFDFIALQKTTPITGGGVTGAYPGGAPTGTFDASPTGNPSVFYYYEPNIDPPDKTIPHSDYKGLATINEKLLVGNGFLFYFRGDRSMNDNNNALPKTATLAVPQNTTLNFKGTLNQGNINVYVPTDVIATNSGTYVTPAGAGNVSTSLSNTNNSSTRDGLHLIGNPYASAIDLDAVTVSNPYNAYIFILNNTGVFGVYQKGSASVYPPALLNNGVGRYILSGQGFFVRANNTGPATTVSFAETNKVTSVATTATPVSFASQPASANLRPQELHVTLSLDSLNANEAVMQFGKAKNRFDDREDAYYISGLSQTTFMASYSSDNKPCLFNLMGSLDSIKTIPLYAEGQTTGRYSMTFNGVSSLDARYKVFLKDDLLKDSLDLSANSTYTFNIDRGNTKTYGDKRFSLVVYPSHIQDHYQLTTFKAIKNNNSVDLDWKTANEGNYTGFKLQRSSDGGKSFTTLGDIQSDGSGNYGFTDINPILEGANQYRLAQTIDNTNKLSNTITVSYLTLNSQTNKLQVYPNPVVSTIQVAVNADTNGGPLSLKVYSIRGELMMSNTFSKGSSLSLNVSKLMQGSYVIKVNDNNKSYGSATFIKL